MSWLAVPFAISAAALVWWLLPAKPTPPSPQPCVGLACANDVSRALWAAWNTLDCDDADDLLLAANCQDDMQNVNTPAVVTKLEKDKQGRSVVHVTVRENTGAVDRWAETVHRNGIVDQKAEPQ